MGNGHKLVLESGCSWSRPVAGVVVAHGRSRCRGEFNHEKANRCSSFWHYVAYSRCIARRPGSARCLGMQWPAVGCCLLRRNLPVVYLRRTRLLAWYSTDPLYVCLPEVRSSAASTSSRRDNRGSVGLGGRDRCARHSARSSSATHPFCRERLNLQTSREMVQCRNGT